MISDIITRNRCYVVACQVSGDTMVRVNISSMCMASDRVVAEHNQAELSKLEARTANSV